MNSIVELSQYRKKANPPSEKLKDGYIKRGNFYHFVKRIDGRLIKISTKQTTRELAKLWVEKNILEPQRDRALGIKPIVDINFSEFADTSVLPFIKATKKPATYEYYKNCLTHLKTFFGGLNLSELTPELIEKYVTKRLTENIQGASKRTKKVSPATINKELTILGVTCKRAIKFHHLKENPVPHVERLTEPSYQAQVLTEEDFNDKFLPVANPCGLYGLTELYILAFYTGMRAGEIFNLKWSHLDFGANRISIWVTKTNEPRHIPMSKFICQMLKNLNKFKKSEYVFVNKQGNKIKRIRKGFKSTLKRAGLPNMRFHDLRHSFVSNCAAKNYTWDQTSAMTGHKSYDMYKHYRHMFDQSVQNLADSFVAPENFKPTNR